MSEPQEAASAALRLETEVAMHRDSGDKYSDLFVADLEAVLAALAALSGKVTELEGALDDALTTVAVYAATGKLQGLVSLEERLHAALAGHPQPERDQATDEAIDREAEADRLYAEHERRAGRAQPERCPTCRSDDPNKLGVRCTSGRLEPDPWHSQATPDTERCHCGAGFTTITKDYLVCSNGHTYGRVEGEPTKGE